MTKQERKNLKKKKLVRGDATVTASSAASGESSPVNKKEPSPKPSETQDDASKLQQKKPEPTLEDYMANYTPAPLKKGTDADDDNSLGKWFPKASVIKSSVCYSNDILAKLVKERKKKEKKLSGSTTNGNTNTTEISEPKAALLLFYQYVQPTWSQAKVSSFLSYLTTIAKKHRTNIGGRIRVSSEGVNAIVSAASTSESQLEPSFEAAQTLRHFIQDLRQFDPIAFAKTDFKFIDGLSADRHFKETKLIPVKELVFYGIREGDCAVGVNVEKKSTDTADGDGGGNDSLDVSKGGKEIKGGIHLNAMEYHEMLKQKDTVVIDVRNHYEAAIGRFDGQMENDSKASDDAAATKDSTNDTDGHDKKEEGRSGAEYIDPKMRKSTDFTSWLAEPDTKQKLEGKTVMMFCTGGIRCERASAYLNSQMGSEVKGVYQLQGGVESYLQAFPEGGHWRGKNFVFDKREAIGAGNVNGDGGVIQDSKKKKQKKDGSNPVLPWGTECAKCHKPWDRYIGKRKCYTCGVPVLVCDGCMSQSSSAQKKKKKKKAKVEESNEKADAKTVTEGDDKSVKENEKKAKMDESNEKADAKTVTKGDEKPAKENKKEKEENLRIRCPLCIEEGVTVPAADVEYTDNGVRNKLGSSSFSESGGGVESADSKDEPKKKKPKDSSSKAAKSVLKYGGGHATKKKEKRKNSRRPCQFGVECIRKDCFFYHPERDGKCQKVAGK
mmetsp:Transcript_2684/g.4153  ORF Transcript_2684/g.4153 Transcript_2684/m.4153 type:complete len:722 (-) Transcript_2684:109-2274(-)